MIFSVPSSHTPSYLCFSPIPPRTPFEDAFDPTTHARTLAPLCTHTHTHTRLCHLLRLTQPSTHTDQTLLLLFQTNLTPRIHSFTACWNWEPWQKGGCGVLHLTKNKGKQLQCNLETDLQAELSFVKIIFL